MRGLYSFVDPRLIQPDLKLARTNYVQLREVFWVKTFFQKKLWPLLYKRANLDLRLTKIFVRLFEFSLLFILKIFQFPLSPI